MASPYFRFPVQEPRSMATWSGGAGGVLGGRRSAEARELSDWPLTRPAGPEPLDPDSLGFVDGLSRNEKTAALVAVAAAGLFLFSKRRSRRRRR